MESELINAPESILNTLHFQPSMNRNNYFHGVPPFDPSIPPPPLGDHQQYQFPVSGIQQNIGMGQTFYNNNNIHHFFGGQGQRHPGGYRRGRARGQGHMYRNNSGNVYTDYAIADAMDGYLEDFNQGLMQGENFQQINYLCEKGDKHKENVQMKNLSSHGLQDGMCDFQVNVDNTSDNFHGNMNKVDTKFTRPRGNRGRGRGGGHGYQRYFGQDKYQKKYVNTSDLHTSVKEKLKDKKYSVKSELSEKERNIEKNSELDDEEDRHGNSMDSRGESYNAKTKVDYRGQRFNQSGSAPIPRPSSRRQYQNTSNKFKKGKQFGSYYDPQNEAYYSKNNSGRAALDSYGSAEYRHQKNVTKDGGGLEQNMVNLKTVVDEYRKHEAAGMEDTQSDDNADVRRNSSIREKAEKKGKENYNMPRSFPGSRGQNQRSGFVRTLSGKVDESQRGLLIEQLTNGTYECMVCFDAVRGQNAVWSCSNCYHVFHLRCVKKWARSSTVNSKEEGWRCPACQNLCGKQPWQYWCFCGKLRDPEWQRMEIPHSCGEVCRKSRGENCLHKCNILCHPGPCPPCNAIVKRSCDCGKTSQTMKCSTVEKVRCDKVCGKALNCGRHFCKITCHSGSCLPCSEIVSQECYKGHERREVICGSKESFEESFSCGGNCSKILACGNHTCEEICHQGDCDLCALSPDQVTTCPCGGTLITEISSKPRTSCLDPITTCGAICGKKLTCGPKGNEHTCKEKCHMGPCGNCEGQTILKCRCGSWEKEFLCMEVQNFTDENPFCCDRRCNKKRSCGKHKCGQQCCVKAEHSCDLICGKKLSCGLHKCDEPCHRGNCPPCLMASFDELTCYCGAEVTYPPIPCGTKPPECHHKCTKSHACDHPVRHNCNSEPECPPCTELTSKYCMGNHELRKNIPCHISNISCGLPCNKSLPCQQHVCIKVCHKGACQEEGETCKQPCNIPRPECKHICGAPCHSGTPCPTTTCKSEIVIKCACGRKEAKVSCMQGGGSSGEMSEYQKITVQNLASSLGTGQAMDMTQFSSKKPNKRQLECDETCAKIERNRRLAIALQIKNPDLTGKPGPPPYTDFLKDYAKNNPHSLASIEKAFSDLVQSAKDSKFPHRSHAFASMKSDQRKVIHELAEFYGCKTQSYDFEPKKNVVATAFKDRCWLPFVTLTALVQRELHPKAPTPIPHVHSEDAIRKTAAAEKQSTEVRGDKKLVYLKPTRETTSNTTRPTKTEKVIDYFDFT